MDGSRGTSAGTVPCLKALWMGQTIRITGKGKSWLFNEEVARNYMGRNFAELVISGYEKLLS
jgi:hypothetical protein